MYYITQKMTTYTATVLNDAEIILNDAELIWNNDKNTETFITELRNGVAARGPRAWVGVWAGRGG